MLHLSSAAIPDLSAHPRLPGLLPSGQPVGHTLSITLLTGAGGHLYIRDYALHDMTQLRFKKGQTTT